eukprot:1177984-Prorocentrum_minimum.AAC.2
MMPGTQGGTRELSIFRVFSATSLADDFWSQSAPGATMEGFSMMRSSITPCDDKRTNQRKGVRNKQQTEEDDENRKGVVQRATCRERTQPAPATDKVRSSFVTSQTTTVNSQTRTVVGGPRPRQGETNGAGDNICATRWWELGRRVLCVHTWSIMHLKVSAHTMEATSKFWSMVWEPSRRISGSMMGTRPAFCAHKKELFRKATRLTLNSSLLMFSQAPLRQEARVARVSRYPVYFEMALSETDMEIVKEGGEGELR